MKYTEKEYNILTELVKLSGKKLGLLINFNADLLKNGVRRKINGDLNERYAFAEV